MSKFWTFAATLLVLGIGFLVLNGNSTSNIDLKDLETECRYDKTQSAEIDLEDGNRISFSGNFPVNRPSHKLDYRYREMDSEIILDIRSEDSVNPVFHNCRGSAVYDFRTDKLDPGFYTIDLRHNGESREKVRIRIG